jgi:HEAT repeat protein
MNPVLARALDNGDSALALRAMTALEATGGVSGLVANADSPLVRALSHPDRAVRFKAAFALARANPASQFPSYFRVVPVLCEAVNASASPAMLLIVTNDGLRNTLTETLRNSDTHYTVYGGDTISGALTQAQRAPAIDVVIMPASLAVERITEIGRTDYRLTGVPVLLTAKTEDLPTLKLKYTSNPGVVVIDEHANEAAISAALAQARADIGVTPIATETANGMSLTALELLGKLAADHRSIYAVGEATDTLIGALKDKRPEVVAASATVIGRLNSPEAQRALAALALADGEAAARSALLENLAESAKRTGNALNGSQVNALIKIVTTESDAKVRGAAAGALGALNVPTNQASGLILQQVR